MIRVSAVNESNADVVWRAHDLLSDEQGLRTTTADIEIVGGDQSLTLVGRVRTETLYNLADSLARTAAGAWPVDNQLINDEQLAMQISTEIGMDPRTADADLRIDVFLGVVRVVGSVRQLQEREAALELAAAMPGAIRVEDHMSLVR